MVPPVLIIGGALMPAHAAPADAPPEVALNRQWAERAFSAAAPGAAAANRLILVHEDAPGDTKVGRCSFGGPMRLGDQVHMRGIGVNSHSVLRATLAQPAERFIARIGLDRNVDNTPASVRFHVAVGGTDVFVTDVIRAGAPPQDIDVPLNGATEVDLIVDVGPDDRGWDQGDWADARFVLQDGTELWLDDLARETQLPAGPPFSFVYDGRPSSELLGTWERAETTEERPDGTAVRTLTFRDPATGLEVAATCMIYTDTAGADWVLRFTNTGTADSPAIEQVQAVDATVGIGLGQPVVLHRLNGAPCLIDDWMPFDQPMAAGQTIAFSATNGRSSNVSPFYNVSWGNGGVITAIGWSGQWASSVALQVGSLRIQSGMQNLKTVLHPGESIRSPRIMQLYWTGEDPWRGHNLFRQTMLAHIVPRENGAPAFPPVVHLSTSFYELNATNQENVLSHLDSVEGLGFEVFWVDAYWTGPDGFPNSMGNYTLPLELVEPKDRFPDGVAAIGRAVKDAGLKYLMWFEPERVASGTRIAREHPEWVFSPGGDGSGLFNLGIPEARQYMTEYLDAAIKTYGLSWLRIDYNIDPLGFWQFADAKDPSRVGMAEMRYVEGLYQMWDDLRAANPGLLIDDCASGGRRVDLETCSRALVLWRSDNTCDMVGDSPDSILKAAIENQLMSAGLNRYLPMSIVGQMGSEPYFFRSGFNGGIAFAQDIRKPDYPREQLRQAIAEGKRIRKYWLGDFYALSAATTNPQDWCVLQYHRPEQGDGMVLAFRRHRSPYSGYDCELRAIDPNATYAVTVCHTYEPEAEVTLRGADLQHINLGIRECPGSVLIEYRRTGGG